MELTTIAIFEMYLVGDEGMEALRGFGT